MQLTEQQINDIVEGKVAIPALSPYHFYGELDKIFAKARVDQNFTRIENGEEFYQLADGRFISDHFLILKDKGEMIILHNEAGYDPSLRATPNFPLLLEKFFKPLNKDEEIESAKANARYVYRVRLLRSYMHIFGDPAHRDLHLTQEVSEEDFLKLQEDFDALNPEVFDTIELLEQTIGNQSDNGPVYKLMKVEGAYTVVVEESQYLSFQIILGQKEGRRLYSFISHNRFTGSNLNMKELYEKLTKNSLPNELKRIIAYAYTLAVGNWKNDEDIGTT